MHPNCIEQEEEDMGGEWKAGPEWGWEKHEKGMQGNKKKNLKQLSFVIAWTSRTVYIRHAKC